MLSPRGSFIAALKPSLIILALTSFFILGLTYCVMGKLHPDEGNYLMAAFQTSKKQLIYKDFAFTQGPVFPLLFSILGKTWGFKIGTFRQINLGIHFLLFLFLALTVFHIYRWGGLFIFLVIYLSNPFNFYNFTIAKLYMLTSFFLGLGGILLLRWNNRKWALCFTGIFFSLAASTRISCIIILFLFWVMSYSRTKVKAIWFLYAFLPGFSFLMLLFFPFYLVSPGNTFFFLISFHLARQLPLKMQVLFKFDFVVSMVRYYGPALLIAISYIWWKPLIKSDTPYIRFFALAYLLYMLVHLPAKVPYIYRYLTIVFPFLALWLTDMLTKILDKLPSFTWKVRFLSTLGLFFFLGALPEGRNSLVLTTPLPLQRVKEVSDFLKNSTKQENKVFSFNPAITIVADRDILQGSESGGLVFSLQKKECKKLNLMHYKDFIDKVKAKKIDALLLTPMIFDIAYPECYVSPVEIRKQIWYHVKQNYKLINTFQRAGLGDEEVSLWLPKK